MKQKPASDPEKPEPEPMPKQEAAVKSEPPKEERKSDINAQITGASNRARQPSPTSPRLAAAADPEVKPTPRPPTALENRWAENVLQEEIQVEQVETTKAAAPQEPVTEDANKEAAAEQEPTSEETNEKAAVNLEPDPEGTGEKKKRKRKSLGRTNQIMTRLTDAELTQFHKRVKKSGLSQGDYLRSAALTGQIVIEERSMTDVALLDELALIRAELGRQGGMLKMTIKPNEGQKQLVPDEWAALIKAINNIDAMKKKLSQLEARMGNGNNNTPFEQKR